MLGGMSKRGNQICAACCSRAPSPFSGGSRGKRTPGASGSTTPSAPRHPGRRLALANNVRILWALLPPGNYTARRRNGRHARRAIGEGGRQSDSHICGPTMDCTGDHVMATGQTSFPKPWLCPCAVEAVVLSRRGSARISIRARRSSALDQRPNIGSNKTMPARKSPCIPGWVHIWAQCHSVRPDVLVGSKN